MDCKENNLDRKGNPMAMSFSLKQNPNEIPSMHTQFKQAQKVKEYMVEI